MPPSSDKHNIVFVFTDQERYFDKWPKDVPARAGPPAKPTGSPSTSTTAPPSCALKFALGHADKAYRRPTPRCSTTSTCPRTDELRHPHGRPHAPGKAATHRVQGQVAPRFRPSTSRSQSASSPRRWTPTVSPTSYGRATWSGTLGGYRYDNVISGTRRLPAAQPGQAARRRKKPWALFVLAGEPPRHHVLQHRRAGHVCPRHGKTPTEKRRLHPRIRSTTRPGAKAPPT